MQHYEDNLKWITEAGKHQLVVGSQARILYSDAEVCACARIYFRPFVCKHSCREHHVRVSCSLP